MTPRSLGCLNGAGISSVSLCQPGPGGRDPTPAPAAPPGRSELGIRGRRGTAPAGGSRSLAALWQEEAIPTTGPCSLHGASCLNWVLAPHKHPHLSQGRGPEPLAWGRGRCWPGAAGPGWGRARCLSGSAARGANSPPTLQTSLLAREKVPVPFIFLSGDVTSVRWFVGIVQGRAAGGGAANQGGERFCLPLLDLPWWLGSSPFPLKTL